MSMERRQFLKVIGAAGAGAGLFGCSTQGAERLLPYVVAPEDVVPGLSTWFRTTCRECPAGCGMDIRTREGRAVKAEGNPLSPIAHGRLCARGQASLHGLYNPDRVPQAFARVDGQLQPLSWDEAEQRLVAALQQAAGRTVFLTAGLTGTMDRLLDEWTAAFGIERVRFDTFAFEPVRTAYRLLFGADVLPSHDFANAEVVVSFGADFMETWLSPVDYAHGFVRAHAYNNGRRGHFVWVGPHQSLTGLNADEWLPARPGTEHLVALAMARIVAEQTGQAGAAASFLQQVDVGAAAEQAGVPEDRIRQVARAFANGGRSLAVGPGVASSSRAATALAAAVALLNYVAGNIGRTVRLDRPELAPGAGSYRAVLDLFERMRRGEVGALLVYGPNPLYSVPLGEDPAGALARVPFIASFNTFPDETTERAHLLLPDHHFLESWGDHVPRAGVYSLVQPVMMPVFQTKQTGDVLLSVARRVGVALSSDATTFYDYLRERWEREIFPRSAPLPEPPAGSPEAIEAVAARAGQSPFENWWRQALQVGVVIVPSEAQAPAPAQFSAAGLAQIDFSVPQFTGAEDAEFHLVVYPSYRFYDGALANRPWLQELPDPISKISWISWVEVNPETAERLGLVEGSIAEVATPYGRVELPVWPHPGLRPDTIAIQLGQGHEALGRYAQNRGVNAAHLIGAEVEQPSGGLVWQQVRASLRATGRWERIPESGNATQAGREIARAMTLAEARSAEPARLAAAAVPAAAAGQERMEAAGGGHGAESHPMEAAVRELQDVGGFGPVTVPAGPQDYPPPGTHYGEYTQTQPRWAMAIDLERCIGCSACITACYAENNIGIVGPEQVKKGRILHWMRIERYFYGHEEHGQEAHEPAEGGYQPTRFIPMLCQQCGNAPCEPVCPVYAAYHTPDGLNGQIYNRCVGTRYCANNCPYKVRYFNWYTWEWPEPLSWQLNPDVTVREKGVMEKCTFCVQRIREAQHRARLEGRSVPDGEIVPACAQTCPGDAIVFGNIKDPNSRVARIAASGRGYRVLEGLNTQSGIVYLKQVLPEGVEA